MKSRMITLLLAIILLFSACSTGGGGESDSPKENDHIVLEIPAFTPEFEGREYTITMIKKLASRYTDEGKGMVEIRDVATNEEIDDSAVDVIMLDTRLTQIRPNVYQDMVNGHYVSLTDMMEKDKSYKPENYVQGVMAAGALGSEQYVIPLTYILPTVFGDEEISKNYGGPIKDDLANYEEFWEKVETMELPLFAQKVFNTKMIHDATFVMSAGNYPNVVAISDGTQEESYLRALAVYQKEAKNVTAFESFENTQATTIEDVVSEKSVLLYKNLGGGFGYLDCLVNNAKTTKDSIKDMFSVSLETNPNMFYGSIPYTPGQTEEVRTAYVNTGLAVSAKSEKQDAAWNFISWCLRQTDLFKTYETQYYAFPVHKSMVTEVLFEGFEELKLTYGEEYLKWMSSIDIADEVTDIGYAYMLDRVAGEAVKQAMAQDTSALTVEQLDQNIRDLYAEGEKIVTQ